jgi:hypothetical protein
MIEAAAAGTRRGDHQAIERRSSALIRVEAVPDEFAEEAAALRIPIADHAPQRSRRFAQRRPVGSELQIRREVANGGEPEPSDR